MHGFELLSSLINSMLAENLKIVEHGNIMSDCNIVEA
jgi:hypothetical protein